VDRRGAGDGRGRQEQGQFHGATVARNFAVHNPRKRSLRSSAGRWSKPLGKAAPAPHLPAASFFDVGARRLQPAEGRRVRPVQAKE
jgi:hypothetical protein